MPEEKMMTIRCLKDQQWSFGFLAKDQVVTVKEHIGKAMLENEYGVEVKGDPNDKALGDLGLEKAVIENPAPEKQVETAPEATKEESVADESGEAKEEAPAAKGGKKAFSKKGE